MVVSSLQIQTVSVLAMKQQAEETGSFMEEDVETGTGSRCRRRGNGGECRRGRAGKRREDG
ncbi:MAG: hypothetical protein K2O65_15270 [Lachnospiraceae bacterium]|nr:hypothetical protein [Lachnospiraceae bacterium]